VEACARGDQGQAEGCPNYRRTDDEVRPASEGRSQASDQIGGSAIPPLAGTAGAVCNSLSPSLTAVQGAARLIHGGTPGAGCRVVDTLGPARARPTVASLVITDSKDLPWLRNPEALLIPELPLCDSPMRSPWIIGQVAACCRRVLGDECYEFTRRPRPPGCAAPCLVVRSRFAAPCPRRPCPSRASGRGWPTRRSRWRSAGGPRRIS
jgi:hypothetical protein